MAASAGKLAAALHRRTRRVTSALAYAALEWVLIALLLINGLLAYAIARFADYFGLSPPCLLCSRVDRLFFQAEGGGDEAGAARWLRDSLCGDHAAEISALGYCLRHRRLAVAREMCEGCRSEWKEKTSDAAGACTCCKAVVRTSLRELEDTITRDEHVLEKVTEEVEDDDRGYVLLAQDDHEEEQSEVDAQQQEDEVMAAVQDESLEFMDQVEDITAIEDDRLVSVVALDEMTVADDSGFHRDVEEEDGMNRVVEDEQDARDVDIGVVLEEKRMLDSSVATRADVIEDSVVPISPVPCPETLSCPTNPSHPDHNSISQDDGDVPEDTSEIGDSTAEEEHIFLPQVQEAISEDDNRTAEVDTNCEVSIGSDICEREQDDHVVRFQDLQEFEEPVVPLAAADDLPLPLEILEPPDQAGEVEQEEVTTSTGLDLQPNEQNEVEEDKAPETPTNSAATQRSDRMFLLERKRSLSLSLDGSVASEMEGGEPSTVDQLKSALQAERKALGALYAELEEERNAAAIATNQTMAMINRLQEEKAAMQMEALQYQRMMEEQSEYDQEALQLLNELVTKREREKQELERELELYRQKVQHYEDRERRRTASFKANGASVSPSGSGTSVSSSGEDSDGHSDDYCELGESPDGGNVQSSSDAALGSMRDQDSTKHLSALDDSLTYFEMERLSILEELKTLEERLFTLEDDDINTSKQVTGHSSSDFDLSADGLQSPEHVVTGDKARFGGRSSISRGKSLLPLFDAVGDETCDQMPSARVGEADQADDSATKPVSVFVKEQERLAIIEEVDHVYERLQALEADKEFLRHCIKSLKKGDKGMDLLQEILQHLRDLRNVELHVKNAGDAIAANSA
ncbi:myosin-binding protein 3-like isoform X1 [Miscanthus floridulus]|uniref:myosin-binding protein 3-like isoform X1 n=1 Tax=Miscanthus floridulus TaxID=154761 RepID=UPI0034583C83